MFAPRSIPSFAAILLTAACSGPAASSADGGVTVAIGTSPSSFDPRVSADEGSERVSYLVYSRLMELDGQLRAAPGLAERLDNPDPLTYVAHLRHGVKFHDGHELTAKDVVYTFTSILDPAFTSPLRGAYRSLASVTAVDDYTVAFVLKEPVTSFPIQLVAPIVPAGAGASLRSRPVGTGPYRFVRYLADDQVVLSSFQDYYGGPPTNTGIVLKIVPDDTMRGLELRKGTVDLVINDIAPDIVHQFESEGRLHIVTSPGTDYAYIGLNLRDHALSDKRVRQAIAYAVDRQAIVDYLRRKFAGVAVGMLPPYSWAFEPGVRVFTHDPARARQILDEAGYRDPDGDGPLPRLTLTLKISTSDFIRLQATVLQQELREVGIAVDVRQYEFATLFADVLKGNFQMVTLQWVGGAVADPDILRRVFHSQQEPPSGFNRGGYNNPEVDRLLDAATRASGDDERKRLYGEVQKLIAEDSPYISLWYRTNVAVMQPAISGLRLGPLGDFRALKDVRKRPS